MRIEFFQKFIEDFYEKEKYRLPNWIPVGIGCGICIYFSLNFEPSFAAASSLLMTLLLICIFFKFQKFIPVALLTVAAGFLFAQLRTMRTDTYMLSEKKERPLSFVATIESCEKTEKGMSFLIDNIRSKKIKHKLHKVLLTWRGKGALSCNEDFSPGAKVLFRAFLAPITPPAFPGAYDFKKQSYFKKISARGFIIKQPKILRQSMYSSFDIFIEKVRHRINKKIESLLPTKTASVCEALITGNKLGISKEMRANFANSGIAHILAISGLHIGIIGFFVFWFARVFLICIPRMHFYFDVKKISAVISLLFVLMYLYISGSTIPSIRAFIMHSMIIIAILINRTALTMRTIAIAATLIMIFLPETILFPSFQMSFGAVIAIVAFYENNLRFSGFWKILSNTITTTIIATIPTTVFSVLTFNQLTLNSIPANILSIPLMSMFIMPVAVVSLSFMLFDFTNYPILIMGFGVDILIKIAEIMSKLPGSFFVMHTPSNLVMCILIFSGLILCLIHHRVRFAGVIGLVLGGCVYCIEKTPDIFISPYAKVIGIKRDDCVYFNHLGYFRSATSAWAKSLGIRKRKKFSESDFISCVDQNTILISLHDKQIIIAPKYFANADILIDKCSEFPELIYLDSMQCVCYKGIKRPWS